MRKLGEQWIEIIDGQEHMVKAVEPFELCQGCLFNCNQGGCCWKGFDSCHMGNYFIIKDLGIIRDGMLSCPYCGEYMEILTDALGFKVRHVCSGTYTMVGTGVYGTKQQVKDELNRRS